MYVEILVTFYTCKYLIFYMENLMDVGKVSKYISTN